MAIRMYANFKICKLNKDRGQYEDLCFEQTGVFAPGGFVFEINGKDIPFDFADVRCGNAVGGEGFVYDTMFEEPDPYYDDDLAEMGLSRADLTAEFLASVSRIKDFHINFEDENGVEVDLGRDEENTAGAPYRIELQGIGFYNKDDAACHEVRQDVLNAFNNGRTTH